jgi:hypothetical protein
MGCDMVVARGQATVNGQALFGLNCHGPRAQWPLLRRLAGQMHAPGSVIKCRAHDVPQVRQTFAVLGLGPRGAWGLTHGINEHNVAVGMATWTSRERCRQPGLDGAELLRLTLERGHSARHAQEVLTDLIARHGQGLGETDGHDHIFLIADHQETVLVEAAGSYWAASECQEVRAVSDTAMIRQDWRRLAPGLVKHATEHGWWLDDGSKLDFSGCLGANPASRANALKRWGRATMLLEQQNGNIDPWFLRRLLGEHFESTLRRSVPGRTEVLPTLTNRFVAVLPPEPEAVAMAWCSFGSPSHGVFFPVFLDGELPALFDEDNVVGDGFLRLPAALDKALSNREELDRWQARVDQQAEDFRIQAGLLKKQGNLGQLQRQATLFMAQTFDDFGREPAGGERRSAPVEDLAFFAE